MAAACDDRIDAIVPRLTWNSLVDSFAFNGALKMFLISVLLGVGGTSSWITGDTGRALDPRFLGWYREALKTNEIPDGLRQAARKRSVGEVIDQIDAPALLTHGWKDLAYPPRETLRTFHGLRDRGVDTRIIFHNGGHTPREFIAVTRKEREYKDRMALRWLDKHVKGKDVPDVPPVSIFERWERNWRTFDDFPPEGVTRESVKLGNIFDSVTSR
ncbi:MAG: CocE/NonD family hydrolase, partial [Halobacteria archaeon]|nr:CocE/NonD family hydrolase [Halobacteria archaeon]